MLVKRHAHYATIVVRNLHFISSSEKTIITKQAPKLKRF